MALISLSLVRLESALREKVLLNSACIMTVKGFIASLSGEKFEGSQITLRNSDILIVGEGIDEIETLASGKIRHKQSRRVSAVEEAKEEPAPAPAPVKKRGRPPKSVSG